MKRIVSLLTLALLMGGCGNPPKFTTTLGINPGIYDCVCNKELVVCPNYIPESWREYCKTAPRWQKGYN